ncbi:MAG: peptidoglycan editing factor PgeF, partial [Bacteroidota bacterium]|nr:peptidoglycan editing factor PgeF [Bacteroidota bacterium]
MIISPSIFKDQPIKAAQSTRLGGVSHSPYDSMNLGMSVNDLKENVIKNRELFFGKSGIGLHQLVISKQVHDNKVYIANAPVITEGYDALITNKPNVFLAISIADCTPILIYDTRNNAVAAIHAGWKGTVAEIVTNTLQKMQETYGTNGSDCIAYIGACIGYTNFEVGEEVGQHFDPAFKKFDEQKQKWFVDLKSTNKKQLLDFGLIDENIEVSPYCTVKDENLFFSHR